MPHDGKHHDDHHGADRVTELFASSRLEEQRSRNSRGHADDQQYEYYYGIKSRTRDQIASFFKRITGG